MIPFRAFLMGLLFAGSLLGGALPAAFARKCPEITTLKSDKLPLQWHVAEPNIINSEEFEKVVINKKGVFCHYSAVFDEEIIVGLKGKKQPINPFRWRVARDGTSAICKEDIDSCAFMDFDQESLDAIIGLIQQAKKDASQKAIDEKKEALKKEQEMAEAAASEEAAAEVMEPKKKDSGVRVF